MDSINIPAYIIIEKHHEGCREEEEDVDSVISFITAGAPNCAEDLWDSESRWVESSYSSQPVSNYSQEQTQTQTQLKRRSLQGSPPHPQRSLSFSSEQFLKSSTHSSRQYSSHKQPPRRQISPVSTPKEIRKLVPTRFTRLTRMADRAKAVATRRTCTPPRRRNSFQRHSMPPHMPLRRDSTNGSSISSCSSLSPAVVARNVRRESFNLNLSTTTVASGRKTLRHKNLQRQLLQQQLVDANSPKGRRKSTGCFRLSTCSSTAPPRLPQRCPSDCPPVLSIMEQ